MPGLVNVHIHFGYESFSMYGDSTGNADNYTPQNLADQFQREAYYGVTTVNDGGSASVPISLQFQQDQAARNFPGTATYFFNAGIVPPNGGPDATLRGGTRPLHANYEVIRGPEARAAVQDVAAKGIRSIKIWIGDRGGSYPAMPREVYEPLIEEAHKAMIKVHAHATNQRDQKDVLRAGADLIVHTVGNAKLDDELLGLIREKKPYWTPIIGSGDRSELCDMDPFSERLLPAKVVADIRATACAPNANASTRDEMLKANLTAMVNSGAKIVLGTDAGIRARYSFGWADHHELLTYVSHGLTPMQAIVAGTSTPAEALGLRDVGLLAAGRKADFIVLNANPLDDIRNTRQIASVYMRGSKLDRDAMLAKWQKTNTTQ
jgi:imidazolonepropionase-like amidohydrolase